jgi:hypothetical protein
MVFAMGVSAQNGKLAATPPMGWNSWDAYGFTIDEKDFRANVEVLAGMKQFGWQYAVIDEGWYMQDPFGKNLTERKYLYDGNGLLEPDEKRFPSARDGHGFKDLADWVHGQGLKFGIHIIRGIPKQVVDANLPIAGSSYRAADAADKQATCPWDDANYGIADNAAGQAYYDSMLKRYAQWGLDFIKVDCISDHPYRPTEIRQIAAAIGKTGRGIVLSLSPGPTQLEHAEEVAKYAQMWRVADDHWDGWEFKGKTAEYPFGLKEEFDRIAAWNQHAKPGSWPDPDMLPEGYLGPHPGKDQARLSNYTQDEERTEFTLWAISRSPMIFGGNLTKLDAFTRGLMTNKKVIEANQRSAGSRPVTQLPVGFENVRVWEGSALALDCVPLYFAFFNLADTSVTLHFTWDQLKGKSTWGPCPVRMAENLWDGSRLKGDEEVGLTLPAHGSAMFELNSPEVHR